MNNKPLPMATLYHGGRPIFTELVPDGGARLDALFHTVPALGELAVGVVYGHLHARPGNQCWLNALRMNRRHWHCCG